MPIMAKRKTLADVQPELVELWQQTPRLTKAQIARRLRVQPHSIANWTRELIEARVIESRYNNGPLQPTATQAKKLQRIRALRQRGKTWAEISAVIGRSRQCVCQFYNHYRPKDTP
jgi:predicted transcriptional regulator